MELIGHLATRLSKRFGKGFTVTGLKRMRQFYRAFPDGSAIPADLGGPDKGAAARHLSRLPEKSASTRHLSTQAGALFPPVLSWTHYRLLITVDRPEARSFYEIEAARESWSVRELERQIASLLFERLSMNRDREQVLALARRGQEIAVPGDLR